MTANVRDDDTEVKDSIVYANELSDQDPIAKIIERFSSLSHLKRVVAWILRYKTSLQRLSKKRKAVESVEIQSNSAVIPINVTELKNAETEILKHVQSLCFREEYDSYWLRR